MGSHDSYAHAWKWLLGQRGPCMHARLARHTKGKNHTGRASLFGSRSLRSLECLFAFSLSCLRLLVCVSVAPVLLDWFLPRFLTPLGTRRMSVSWFYSPCKVDDLRWLYFRFEAMCRRCFATLDSIWCRSLLVPFLPVLRMQLFFMRHFSLCLFRSIWARLV